MPRKRKDILEEVSGGRPSSSLVQWWVSGGSCYVNLSPEDARRAAQGAALRQSFAEAEELESRYAKLSPLSDAEKHRIGAHGEVAAALALGLKWEPQAGVLGGPDLPLGIEVRTRRFDPTMDRVPDLMIFPFDKPKFDAPFVLVIAHGFHTFRLAGWLYGREANRGRYLRLRDHPRFTPKGVLCVPVQELRPMCDLRSIILGAIPQEVAA